MEYIKWKEELSVNNTQIDNQHKELFRLINEFYNGVVNQTGKSAMSKVIYDLEAYVITHFKTEEEKMERAGYDLIKEHKAEHAKFIETVADFRKRFNDGRLLLSLEVTAFIKNWITDHISQTDQQYKGKIW